jgi:hypothetical protein
MKIAVVTFANNGYSELINRQQTEFKKYSNCDYFHFSNFEEINSPSHSEIPYAFKPYAIKKVKDLGYDIVLWADSPVYPVKKITAILNKLKTKGVLFVDNVGWSIASYTNDKCLELLQMDKKKADKSKMVMACFMAFDFRTELANKIFSEYYNHAISGAYNGEWSNHRHDQSVISILAVRYKIRLTHPKTIICYANEPTHTWCEHSCLISKRTL